MTLPPVAIRPATALRRFAGEYRLPGGQSIEVRMQGGRLFIKTRNGEILRLFSPWPMVSSDQALNLGDRQTMISATIDAISRHDYTPLLSRLIEEVSEGDERVWWDKQWPQWIRDLGPYSGTDFAGTNFI